MPLVLPVEPSQDACLCGSMPPVGSVLDGRVQRYGWAKAFWEVFKYTLKFSQLPIALNYQVAEQLQRRRLLISFGAFWGTKVPEELIDDPLEQDYVEYFYEWVTDQYQLQSVQHVAVDGVG